MAASEPHTSLANLPKILNSQFFLDPDGHITINDLLNKEVKPGWQHLSTKVIGISEAALWVRTSFRVDRDEPKEALIENE